MPLLSPITALQLIEQVDDFETITALMCTCREMHNLFTHYEKTIVKYWLENHADRLMPPSGVLLSSATHERVVIPPLTFDIIKEFSLRKRRIDALFQPPDGPILYFISQLRCWDIMAGAQRERFVAGLRGACELADRLGDCVAHVQYLHDQEKKKGSQGEDQDQAVTAAEDIALEKSRIARKAHWERRRLIESLDTMDLAYLYYLVYILQHQIHGLTDTNTDDVYTQEARMEVFLRQGCLALRAWAHVQRSWVVGTDPKLAALDRHFELQAKATLVEVMGFENGGAAEVEEEWEDDGRGVLKGVKAGMLRVLAGRLFDVEEAVPKLEMDDVVHVLVVADTGCLRVVGGLVG